MVDETSRDVGGWTRSYRSMQSHPVARHNGMFRLWMYCIWLANWADKLDVVPGTTSPIKIKRGQFITGRESLLNSVYGPMYRADDKPSSRTLWRWLDSLTQLGCVSVTTLSNRCSIVTVINYEVYQSKDCDDVQPDGRDVSRSCPADRPADVPHIDPPVSTTKELKKDKNEKKGRRTPQAAFVRPTLAEVQAYCNERKNRVDPQAFIDHYESNGWKVGGKSPMKDWQASVRTWERNEFGGKHNGRNSGGRVEMPKPNYVGSNETGELCEQYMPG